MLGSNTEAKEFRTVGECGERDAELMQGLLNSCLAARALSGQLNEMACGCADVVYNAAQAMLVWRHKCQRAMHPIRWQMHQSDRGSRNKTWCWL